MILFSVALVGVYWERLPVLRLEQRRVAGREQPLARRSEEQPELSEESLVHLHPHRAPISATQPMGIPPTATQLTDTRPTVIRATRAIDSRVTRDTPLIPVLRVMGTQAIRDSLLTLLHRAMDTQATQDSPPTPPRVTDRQATRGTPIPDPRPLRRQATRDGQLTQVVRAMDIRARRPILRTPVPVPVTEIRSLAIPAIALRRTGRLGPSTLSSLLAEFWPDTKSSQRCAGGWSDRRMSFAVHCMISIRRGTGL
jgi:hypothetical protein